MLRARSWFRITAGQKDYAGRMKQMEQSRNEHYAGLGIPPGPPTNKGIWGVAGLPAGWQETTGQALTNKTLGNYDIPDNWPRPPIKNQPGDVPGPPVQYGPPVNPNNVEPGYGYSLPLPLPEDDIYFYHSDHLGSTSYVTDADANSTQFVPACRRHGAMCLLAKHLWMSTPPAPACPISLTARNKMPRPDFFITGRGIMMLRSIGFMGWIRLQKGIIFGRQLTIQ